MRRRELGVALVLCAGARPGMTATPGGKGLTISRARLLDGSVWVVPQSGPVRVEVILRNTSDEPIPVWDPSNSEGSRSLRFLVTGTNGKSVTLIPPGVERSGIPTAVEIAPGAELAIIVDLARTDGARSIEPGDWQARPLYRNRQAATGPVRKIWTGEIGGPEFEFQVRMSKR